MNHDLYDLLMTIKYEERREEWTIRYSDGCAWIRTGTNMKVRTREERYYWICGYAIRVIRQSSGEIALVSVS